MLFRAVINEVDNDYRAWSGSEDLLVSSWDEAIRYCRDNTWTGYSYSVSFLIHIETKTVINSLKEYNQFIKEI